jgi:hypothetical protein
MAEDSEQFPRRRFGIRQACRLGLWGLTAAGAVALVVHLGLSDAGLERIAIGLANLHGEPSADAGPTREEEARKVGETVRMLAADRERLLKRIDAIERNLEDITGSLAGATPQTLPWPEPAPAVAPPATFTAPVPRAAPLPPAAPSPPADAPAAKTEYGIDLGGAPTVEGLRALWAAARAKHGGLLEGLRPVVGVRESSRPSTIELRLLAGPIPSASSAARLCATLAAAGAVCQPSVFDGQRLALR